jgi:phosphatidate cytidylyltransferase
MKSANWNDLTVRVTSGLGMVALGLVSVWAGGLWFHALIAVICGLMVWELVHLLDTGRTRSRTVLGMATAAAAMVAIELPLGFALPLLFLPSMLGLMRMQTGGVSYAVYAALIMIAGYGMMMLRDDFGLVWILWLVVVVVLTDVAGYFAGRAFGGPKLWPRVSPSKTWSGTLAGWAAAAATGAAFSTATGAGVALVGVSVAVSMASQIGDITESAIKRRAGVKDSSALIPGHGGLMDRFDGMLGAALFVVVIGLVAGFPPGAE